MTRKPLSILIAGLFVAAPAMAQDLGSQWVHQGSVTLGGIWSDLDGRDVSRAEKYRDLGDGVLSGIELRSRGPGGMWLDLFGENFGRDDMYFNVRGGQWDAWKYRLYYDWIPQNRLFEGRTPFSGSGGNELRATFPRPDPALWESVDIGYKRKDLGGYFEWQRNSPWYFRVDANQVVTEGTKIGAAANGTSPGNGFVDLAIPVDYTTTNASFEAGYSTTKYQFAISYSLSEFENSNKTVTWSNPFWANGIDTTHLAPDNDYQRLAISGAVRQLPWNSTLSARATWDRLESSTNLATSALNGTGASAFGATNPTPGTFDGEVENTTFTLAWAGSPTKGVDTRAWYNYAKRDDQSTLVTYRPVSGLSCGTVVVGGVSVPGPCSNEQEGYTRWDAGGDVYWRVAPGHRVGGGISYENLEVERPDYDEAETTKIWAEYRNTMLPGLTGRLKYTYTDRDSNFLLNNAGANTNDVLYMERYIGRYDLQPLERHEVKLIGDWSPAQHVDLAVEAIWKDTNYKRSGREIVYSATSLSPQDDFLGRTGDERFEIYGSASFGDPGKFRATLFADYERVQYDSFHRNVGAGSCPTTSGGVTATNCFDPGTTQNSIAYNWSARNEDENWAFGVGVDWPVMSNLLIKASYLYVKTDGSADIAAQNNFGNPLPILFYDDTKMQSFNLKGIWRYNKNWEFTLGYAYEKYEYSDDQYNGYQYTIPFPGVSNNTSQSYFNGFNAFTNYDANIVYLYASYKFDTVKPYVAPPVAVAAPAPTAAPVPAPKPAPAAAPAPAPKPPPAAPMDAPVQKITLQSKALFDFDKAVLKPEGRAAIDAEVIAKLPQVQRLQLVLVSGHTDRIGTDAYNQKLSERRSDAVRDYLVSKGVPKDKVETVGLGEKQPVTGNNCQQKNQKELIACLQPDRRVEVEVKGESVK
jgi:MtrB/PioB family decaheme-associated outer membrane protein